MTAVITVVGDEAAHLVTDGAGVDAAGLVQLIAPKAHIFPHIKAAIALRGMHVAFPVFQTHLAGIADSYDGLKAHFAEGFQQDWELHKEELAKAFGPSVLVFDLFVVGWSEAKNGPDAYAFFSHARHAGEAAYRVTDLDYVCATPELPAHFLERLAPKLSGVGFDRAAIKIMEEQRRLIATAADSPTLAEPNSIVGGFVQVTTVTVDAITTRVVHRWPDKLGERIVPSPRYNFSAFGRHVAT